MGHAYKAVQWTPFKVRFDLVLAVGVLAFLAAHVTAALAAPATLQAHPVQIGMRALGACAFSLLTLILCIGPAARFSPRVLPLLYNRRHLGVACFALALSHAALVLVWHHGFADVNPLISLLTSNPRYESIGGFPFESLGLAALLVLLLMAATSHDFWNAHLGPRVWKALHMSVYGAYALIVAHVLLGAAQAEKSVGYAAAVTASAVGVAVLHLAAGLKQRSRDAATPAAAGGWLEVGPLASIPDGCARIVQPEAGEAIAIFRAGDRLYALSNRCRHQGGPLGEGRIVDGCVTCPWHGFQYRPEDGRAPQPYTERVATYPTRIEAGIAYVRAIPNPMEPSS